ncbi:MAG: phosphatidylserine decarboxylase [Geodermatophilaceae bacterium]
MRPAGIDRDGWPFIAAFALPALLLAAAGRRAAALPPGVLAAAMALFFRNPDRSCDHLQVDPADVLAPADGNVVHAGRPEPGVAPPGEWQQISIFLSLLDVHMNRSPYLGHVTRTDYRPGRYLAAFRPGAATENERTEIWLADGPERTVVFRQVVGLLARRIVLRAAVGDRLRTGQRIGLMKFGSRMDVFVPPDCTVLVDKGDRVRGGETVIARW